MSQDNGWGAPLRDSNFITVGDDAEKGQVLEVVGLILDIEVDDKFSDEGKARRKYKLELAGGDQKYLSDNARLSVITEDMIGKLVRVEFGGFIKGSRGNKIKDLKVFVREPSEAPAELQAQFPSLG